MDFCHISPTNFLQTFCSEQQSHLLLAHLVENDTDYRQWYQNTKRHSQPPMYILDNSAFEMYKQNKPMYPSEKLIDLGRQVKADYIVMSDYPNQPWEKTRDAALTLGYEFKKAGFGTFYCPQAEIGNIQDLLRSFAFAASSDLVDYIGVSILAIPNAFGVESNNKLQRFLSRWKFMQLLEEMQILDTIARNKKKLHFLGMVDGPNEIELVAKYKDLIYTWDSSAAIWAGLNGIRFDHSPTGLINGKFEKEVIFSLDRTHVTDDKMTAVRYNINYINDLCK